MQPTITFIPKARAVLTIFQPSRMPVHFISLMFMPVKAPMMPRMSASLCMLSSANMGRGDCCVTQAISSSWVLGIGCSTITTPCSCSHRIMSSACCLSFHPWLASTAMGRGVTLRMVSIISLSLSLPSFTFRMLNLSAHSFVFSRTTSGLSMPMVKVVEGAFEGFSPHI